MMDMDVVTGYLFGIELILIIIAGMLAILVWLAIGKTIRRR